MSINKEGFCQTFVVSFLKKLQLAGCDFVFYSVPNGGFRNKAEAARLKNEGMLSGVPDMQIISKGNMFFIEFKKEAGRLSPEQKDFIDKAERYGFVVYIVKGDTPQEFVHQVANIMDQNGISGRSISDGCVSSALGSTVLKS